MISIYLSVDLQRQLVASRKMATATLLWMRLQFIRIKVYRSYQSKLSIVSKGREGLDFGFFSDWSSGYCLSIRERHLFFTLSLFAT